MLETVKRCIRKRETRTFDERFVEYMLDVQNKNVLLEMKFLRTHNQLDVLQLDHLISNSLRDVITI